MCPLDIVEFFVLNFIYVMLHSLILDCHQSHTVLILEPFHPNPKSFYDHVPREDVRVTQVNTQE